MKAKSQIKVFISYRRDGGIDTARWLHDQLKARGYDVFLDMESLRSGAFNAALFQQIRDCDVFLPVLTKDSLDRCAQESDWVRQEIAYALHCGMRIIPLMKDDFVFPETLPHEIEAIRVQNGLKISYEFFDAFMDKLEEYILADAGKGPKIPWGKYAVIALCAAALIGAIIWGISALGKTGPADETDSTADPAQTAETTQPPETTEPAEDAEAALAWGNSSGNLCNRGFVSTDGWNAGGHGAVKFINRLEPWNYWYNSNNHDIVAQREGEDMLHLGADLELSFLQVTADWFYYVDGGNLCRVQRLSDGAAIGEAETLVTEVSPDNDLILEENAVWFWREGKGLYVSDLSGGERLLLEREDTWDVDLMGKEGNWIYGYDDETVWRVHVESGETETVLNASSFADSTIAGGNVYGVWVYVIVTDQGQDELACADRIYRMHTDGSGLELLYIAQSREQRIQSVCLGEKSGLRLYMTDDAGDCYCSANAGNGKTIEFRVNTELSYPAELGVDCGNSVTNLCNAAFLIEKTNGGMGYIGDNAVQYHNWLEYQDQSYYYDAEEGAIQLIWDDGSGQKWEKLLEDCQCRYLYVTPDWLYCVLEEDGVSTLYRAQNLPQEHTIGQLQELVSGLFAENGVAIGNGCVYYWMLDEGLYRARTDGTGAELLYDKGSASSCAGWYTFDVTDETLYFWTASYGLYSVSLEDGKASSVYSTKEDTQGQVVHAAAQGDVFYFVRRCDGAPDELWQVNRDGTNASLLYTAEDTGSRITQLNTTGKAVYFKLTHDGAVSMYKIPLSTGTPELVKEY